MARPRVIILERPELPSNPNFYRYALWAVVPVARQVFYANPTATSAWKDAPAPNIAELQAGQITEKVDTLQVAVGAAVADVELFLQTRWQAFQDHILNDNTWLVYGSTWDGTTWTITGVA